MVVGHCAVDQGAKISPAMVPYAELSDIDKAKGACFLAVVKALSAA